MSSDEYGDEEAEEEFRFFGTPLEPYSEDAFPTKRPIAIEDQVAKDDHGRRRFHGAFTGGFSAGFYNTVGSSEGWTPSDFKSSRTEKATTARAQKPEDFMDDEDVGEFGIAPQLVRATRDYAGATSRKRKRANLMIDGPIPGEPVLESILRAGNETVGYFLMKNIGSKRRKREAATRTSNNISTKVYGCQMPNVVNLVEEQTETKPEYAIHELYKLYLSVPKSNTFGMGYVGLDKTEKKIDIAAHLSVRERNNKKLSISGQAFGVGALEEDDEDIYTREDMSRYDFELTSENYDRSCSASVPTIDVPKKKLIFDLFVPAASKVFLKQDKYPPPDIPVSFTGKYKQKKSRFEPVTIEISKLPSQSVAERKRMNADVRAESLNEDHDSRNCDSATSSDAKKSVDISKSDTSTKTSSLFTFPGLTFDRFVSAQSNDDDEKESSLKESVVELCHGTEEMRNAIKLKMFGPLTHSIEDWQPCSFLCKRFNVPEPKQDFSNQKSGGKKGRTKNLIFEYQKHIEDSALDDHNAGLFVTTKLSIPAKLHEGEEILPIATVTPSNSLAPKVEVGSSVQEPTVAKALVCTKGHQVDLTERINAAENVDLFKAVFLSSSEDESESEDVKSEKDVVKKQEMATTVLSDMLIPQIKTKHRGILSDIGSVSMSVSTTPSQTRSDEDNDKRVVTDSTTKLKLSLDDRDMYGPRLPGHLEVARLSSTGLASSTLSLATEEDESEWIEKDRLNVIDVVVVKKHHKKHRHRKKEKRKKKSKKSSKC